MQLEKAKDLEIIPTSDLEDLIWRFEKLKLTLI